MPKAVSDSSPLIHLAGIGRLKLVRQFYKKVLIPSAVWKEVVEEGQSRPVNESVIRLLELELHAGEAEAIALAIECHPEVVFWMRQRQGK